MRKINVAILFGGKSCEHEISIPSAKNIFNKIDKKKYNPIVIKIDKLGKWLLIDNPEAMFNTNDKLSINISSSGIPVAIIPQGEGRIFCFSKD